MAALVEEHADHAVDVPSARRAHPQILACPVARAIVGMLQHAATAQMIRPFRSLAFEVGVPDEIGHAQAAAFGVVHRQNACGMIGRMAHRIIRLADLLAPDTVPTRCATRRGCTLACEERRCRGNSKCESAGDGRAKPYPSHGADFA